MIPRIAVEEPRDAGITTRALINYAQSLIHTAGEVADDITRQRLIRTARTALDLAEVLVSHVPNIPVEYPDDYDAEVLVYLRNLV